MALKTFSTKFIGGITAGSTAIVGSGFGINAAVNGGSINSDQNIEALGGALTMTI